MISMRPFEDLLTQKNLVVVSNKRPIQIYSARVLKMFRLDDCPVVRIAGAGGAVPTALRVARHCVARLSEELGWKVKSEIVDESEILVQDLTAVGFGEIAADTGQAERKVKQIIVELSRLEIS